MLNFEKNSVKIKIKEENMADSITYKELITKNKDAYDIIDIRSTDDFEFGHIPGAINIPENQFESTILSLNKNKEYYLYCKAGIKSESAADILCSKGFKAYHLKDGYVGFLREQIK